ncbi:DciA family protein [Herbaspirillum sp. RV1423]|uniref:DciA family protein n=1 Tax=Herbaspirillum sp. RV1423 TaxID=1443993 RepID=UPI0004B884A0|nr:DciA family protein [Herbaspirillum sp. RV1423]
MKYPSTFTPYRRGPSAAQLMRKPRDATDFLRSDNAMATLMPAITRMASLQKSCAAILPAIFKSCDVMNFEGGQLVLSMPNAALAAKLKQQLPKLQERLLKDGWQVNAIRIKVQVGKNYVVPVVRRQLTLSEQAVSAFADLNDALEDSPRNQALKTALANMVRRNSGVK